MKNKVFLGGTCNDSTWRDELISVLQVDYFNPVVDDWTAECQAVEMTQKEVTCNVHLYVITSQMIGVFSIAEVVDSVHTKGKATILHIIPGGFDKGQLKSLKAVADLVRLRGGVSYIDAELNRTARIINTAFKD